VGEGQELHGVRVLGVTVEGASVHVDLYGSDDNLCGYVSFVFEQVEERRSRLEALRTWARLGTSLTFVSTGDTVTLLDGATGAGDDWVSRQGSP